MDIDARKVACFDLEGPLSPEDHAFRLFVDYVQEGDQVFAVLSRYDDLLTERCRIGYEPGDTLALILPFVIAQGVSPEELRKHAEAHATLVAGAVDMARGSLSSGRELRVITTSFAPFAEEVCRKLGLDGSWLYCTPLPPELWDSMFAAGGQELVLKTENELRERFGSAGNLSDGKYDHEIIRFLDNFFLKSLPAVGVPYPGSVVQPIGGRRKARALERIARQLEVSLSRIAYVGDSITDVAAFSLLDAAGGLGIAFNGNAYALGAATVGVASLSLADLLPVLSAWEQGGHESVLAYVRSSPSDASGCHLAWLPGLGADALGEIRSRHAATRRAVRADAAGLG